MHGGELEVTDYTFNPNAKPPWNHQLEGFNRFKDDPYCGLFFDQRCGKTRTAIDIIGYRYEVVHDIDSVLIVAWPNGVHRNWVSDEIPTWLPIRIPRRCLIWRSGQHTRKTFKQEFELLLRSKALAVLAVNAEALCSKTCKDHIRTFLEARNSVALVVDEADWASSAGASRTDVIIKISTWKVIKLKMILTGTPSTESPFQLFSQMNILRPAFFGFRDFLIFKHHFGEYEWEEAPVQVPLRMHGKVQRFKNGRVKLVDKLDEDGSPVIAIDKKTGKPKMRTKRSSNYSTGAQFELIKRGADGNPLYRNLDELHAKMAPHVMRVLRSDVSDAPEKVYQKRYYTPSVEQLRVYNELLEEFRAELKSGYVVEAAHVLTRWLRLQQVLSNRLPPREEGLICGSCDGNGCDECDNVGIVLTQLPEEIVDSTCDPRLDALRIELQDRPAKSIVWCRFQHEVSAVIGLVKSMGAVPVRFDGLVDEADRKINLQEFRHGCADILVGNAAAGGRGLPMEVADLAVFYSNYFSLRVRQQVEDRTEALFKKTATGVVDLIAEGTIDEKIVATLRSKDELSRLIMRDGPRAWL